VGHYLVTGGAGFIGSHITDELLAGGHEVRVVDDLSLGDVANLEHVRGRIDFIEGSVLDVDLLQRAFDGIDGVFHEAALPSVPRSVEDPIGCHAVNATGTINVLDAARKAGAKVVYAGSSSAYGDTSVLPKDEDMRPNPLSPYAAAKLAGEHYLSSFARVYGLRTVTLRYFNVFGPRQRADSPYSGVIAKFCQTALAGGTCFVDGDGEQSRDFTYVEDVARGNILAMEADLPGGTLLNLAGGNRVTLLQLLDSLEALVGGPVAREHRDQRAGDVKHSQAAVERAAESIGFRTEISFDEGLRRTLDWYRSRAASASPDNPASDNPAPDNPVETNS